MSSGKKRTISPEQQAAMQAGRQRKKVHEERVAQLAELDERLAKGAKEASQPVRVRTKRRRRY